MSERPTVSDAAIRMAQDAVDLAEVELAARREELERLRSLAALNGK